MQSFRPEKWVRRGLGRLSSATRSARGPPGGYPPRQVLPKEARERVLLGVPVGDKLNLAVSSDAGSEEAR